MFRPPIALSSRNRFIFILSPSFVSGFRTVTSSFTDVLSIYLKRWTPHLSNMASGPIVNIRRDVDDKFYRYR